MKLTLNNIKNNIISILQIMMCTICNKFIVTEEIPEKEEYLCKLCKIKKQVYLNNYDNCLYYPPNGINKINVFDDGNQKYENDPNVWLQIGHWVEHPEKIILINNITHKIIYSISNWKVSNII
jgi:hypothetical protein